MLSARRKSDGEIVNAYFESKANAPFFCLVCEDVVILKTGKNRINHFAHENPLACRDATGESEAHRRCKMEIYEALLREPHIRNVVLERPLGTVRPDISFYLNGVMVAIEVQLSSLLLETIMYRTREYFKKGIHVLWLLQWTPELDGKRYAPALWERWIHTLYFGRGYYWTRGLEVVDYTLEPSFKTVPIKTWRGKNGKRMTAGGYSVRSRRYKTAVRGGTFNMATDFILKERFLWKGNELTVPDAKLFVLRRAP